MQASPDANTAENTEYVTKEHSVPEHPPQSPRLPQEFEKWTQDSEGLEKVESEKTRSEEALVIKKVSLRSERLEKARPEEVRPEEVLGLEKAELNEGVSEARREKAKAKKALKLKKAKAKKALKLEEAGAKKALRLEKARLEKAARGKKGANRLTHNQIEPKGIAQDDVEEIATSTQPEIAEGSPTTYKASSGKLQETPEAEDKKANDSDSPSRVSHGQTAQKLDDIMDILGSSKKPEKSKKPLNPVRNSESFMTDKKIKSIVLEMLSELRSKGEVLDMNSGRVDAMISNYGNQLLARLSAASKTTSKSLGQSKVIF